MKQLWGLLLLGALPVGCSSPVSVVETAVGKTQVVWTAVPTQTPYPTHTPRPTYTALPTLTPEPTVVITHEVTREVLVTVTTAPYFVELFRFTGAGHETTDVFAMQSGEIQIAWMYAGPNTFAIYFMNLGQKGAELLENAVGLAEGQRLLNVNMSDGYYFDFRSATGAWELVVEYRP
jgi:hypothetical protein